jgi:hypothetical protein
MLLSKGLEPFEKRHLQQGASHTQNPTSSRAAKRATAPQMISPDYMDFVEPQHLTAAVNNNPKSTVCRKRKVLVMSSDVKSGDIQRAS